MRGLVAGCLRSGSPGIRRADVRGGGCGRYLGDMKLIGKKVAVLAAGLLLLMALVALPGRAAGVDDVAELALAKRTEALRAGLQGGMWEGTMPGLLAVALLDGHGLDAAARFERVARSPEASAGARTVAWFHLYGYYRITGDHDGAVEALEHLKASPALASRLFVGAVPDEVPAVVGMPGMDRPESEAEQAAEARAGGASYSVQIGAFGSRGNAEGLARRQAQRGYTVEVVPLTRSNGTLHAVWVGQFASHDEAVSFGRRVFGTPGRDFAVVERKP